MFDLSQLRAIGKIVAKQAREKAAADPQAANDIIDMAPLLVPWREGKWARFAVCIYERMPYWCVIAHDSTNNPMWSPAHDTALWAIYHGRDAAHALPFKAEGHNPYMAGEWCTEEGEAYECIADNTVWPPSVLPKNWEKEVKNDG